MAESAPRRLDQPRTGRRINLGIDPDAFGRFSEGLARLMGTGKFLFWQTLFVIFWIAVNVIAGISGWDPYPFILLNLAFSTQAAYAAPLILLAQNRQDDRDRVSLDDDRTRSAQTKADTEYLARELAALRLNIGDVATRDYLRGELDRMRDDLHELTDALRSLGLATPDSADDGKTRDKAGDKSKKSKRGKGSGGSGGPSTTTVLDPPTDGAPA